MRIATAAFLLLLSSCTYLKNVAVQAHYTELQNSDPSMLNLKHMIDRSSYFVYGKVSTDFPIEDKTPLAIVAFSDHFQNGEIVDVMRAVKPGTHYGLILPPGTYEIIAFADTNANGIFESSEAVGQRDLTLDKDTNTHYVLGNADISFRQMEPLDRVFNLPVTGSSDTQQSLFYPPDSLRQLSDPLFDPEMSALGMYHPAAFSEIARTMFYALEEDLAYKIPVVFVHGINGSAREFETMVNQLDRTRFKPWFFYYPSGGDLNQIAQFFYNLFLSGNIIPINKKIPMVIVAHSMGGLVVREAINLLQEEQNTKLLFISLATPFGGHPAAADGEANGLIVLPSWRDLNPASDFIAQLYRKPLPDYVTHRLLYAYGNKSTFKLGENSDGVVPLSSQLALTAQTQASTQLGFNTSHTGILQNREAINDVIQAIGHMETDIPKEHLHYLFKGGFKVPLSDQYDQLQVHALRTYGKYIRALVAQKIEPFNAEQQRFLESLSGKREAYEYAGKAWRKFIIDYPNWPDLD